MSLPLAEVNYCVRCGAHLEREFLFGKVRPVCPKCGWIYFSDPKVAVAVVIRNEDKVLLGRRVNEPGRGQWTLPGGFVDAEEDPRLAARRECLEETGLDVEITELMDVVYGQSHPRGAHILMIYRGVVRGGQLNPSDDVDDVAFYPLHDLPVLAFPSTTNILEKLGVQGSSSQ